MFLNALEKSLTGSLLLRQFLVHLLGQWRNDTDRLQQGIITVQRNYWKVCADIFRLATRVVECTSAVTLEYWNEASGEGNSELLAYKKAQKERLINRGIPVRRTFLFDSVTDETRMKTFLELALSQLNEGFCVYYVDLSSINDKDHRTIANADFALLDSDIIMLGRLSGVNQGVYYYDFFDLKAIPGFFQDTETSSLSSDFLRARQLFAKANAFGNVGGEPQLIIDSYRKHIAEFPGLNGYGRNFKTAIETAAGKIRGWK